MALGYDLASSKACTTMKDSPANIADAWIHLQQVDQDSGEAKRLQWSANELNRLAIRSAKECWSVIAEILSRSSSEWVLANLGSGPLETLLTLHPDETIYLLERDVGKSWGLRFAASHVWRDSIPKHLCERLDALVGLRGD